MKALRIMDVPVLMFVWILCVTTDWSSGTKMALNLAAVAGLCVKEFLVHRHLQRVAGGTPHAVRPAGVRSFAAATAAA
ncbi:hypothetical protein QNO08_10030 [Arthrobacter sp. zg-Y820]|uniref:hypothetical protein n=1 Tax=unclassified Arthrobacter TaxID=235627 RepID=UPI001E3B3610|nr:MULTISPECIES: hypothetical protein [unclassified Arthrobacter]MCC9196542.1 hypothetical protein [Arthrobacter sp. zg-Y820]MDK1279404.1 hypothetical protein [Arthrobacter sp. zg.Y820]WIB08215.1 hypothetical protein QNO08_10030 [Arthrobacter sp. zg-Y820]